jgi:predicted  nucleic acid-binding Zn-ribbon protein
MNLKRRLRTLERVVVPPDDDCCEACGYEPGSRLEFTVSFGDEPDERPDVCPECGRVLVFRLEFDSPRGVDGG